MDYDKSDGGARGCAPKKKLSTKKPDKTVYENRSIHHGMLAQAFNFQPRHMRSTGHTRCAQREKGAPGGALSNYLLIGFRRFDVVSSPVAEIKFPEEI
ncbi:hypothetical protein K3X13_01070 [Aliiroseovarius crassostreae]|uniref:hypothetical protein n=1 Tax=Aliiroseovarius crassostreae TaxID=154981 RepID=UPI00220890E8|nr:hypothetical protein [Aliiroseovarius crassostreae]UWP92490.1 hypothetical protein K3X13_01070 [Aliiroseovarius crassostreae]